MAAPAKFSRTQRRSLATLVCILLILATGACATVALPSPESRAMAVRTEQLDPAGLPASSTTLPLDPSLTAVSQFEDTPAAPVPATTPVVSLPLVMADPTAAATATPFQPEPTFTETITPSDLRFAVIGDYGSGEQPEADVAELVKSWEPEFIITLGDNNYPSGSAETIDANIGQFYQEFIYSYSGGYGEGEPTGTNRFFPTLGNHDWDSEGGQPYLDYFSLPGNERYYDFTWGPVHLFALSSDSREPDGVGSSSEQADWLQERLAASTTPWQIVYMHHSPFSSGTQGPVEWMRWPFPEWGADAVLSGHDHIYERFSIEGFPYFVNGIGGGAIYAFKETAEGSQARYNADYGALLVEASEERMLFQFVTRQGEVIDTYELARP